MQYFIAVFILFRLSSVSHCFDHFFVNDGFQHVTQILEEAIRIENASFAPVETLWIEQPLDHFNASVNHPWKMRYFQRLDLWKPNGPIYLWIGGEDETHESWLLSGLTAELARETNGALFASEHRYYGKSMPNMGKLKYLNSRQALADLSALLKFIKSNQKFKSSKVVVVGGSYAGNLATWMKRLYPDKVDAALASSAPVLAKLDFYEYVETVGDVFKKYGTKGCYKFIETQFSRYTEAFKTQKGIQKLKKDENICDYSDMNRSENQQAFVNDRLSDFLAVTQYGDEQKIKSHCNKIMNHKGVHDINSEKFTNGCFDVNFDAWVLAIKDGPTYHHWFFQKCTEFSYFKSTNSNRHPFTKNVNVKTFYKMCEMVFGKEISGKTIAKAVEDTNKLYGGLKPKVQKVIFVNGEIDPWHRLSILKDLSKDAPAIFIPKTSHCADLGHPLKTDPPELTEARKIIKKTIKRWIQ